MKSLQIGRILIGLLLIISIYLYYTAPQVFSYSFCLNCFCIFLITACLLLVNNCKKCQTMILFESLFTISFFFTNYVYPIFLYADNPYFSLFTFSFNEDIISRATALATIGYCSYSLFQYEENDIQYNTEIEKTTYSQVTSFEIILLFALLLIYLYQALPALTGGYSYSGGAGFFQIFAIFLSFKRLYNHDIHHPISRDIALWSIIAIYMVINLLVGNRGDPLYVAMAIFLSFSLFVHKVSNKIFISAIIAGLAIFYIIGEARGGEDGSMINKISSVEKVDNEGTGGIFMYGKELIINNRTLYVLMDYVDKNGLNYGQTWQMNLYSIVPFLQSFMLKFFDIRPELFASANLTTYLEFGKDNADAFGLGTNLIGDIYICYGAIGVSVFMAILGHIVKVSYRKSTNDALFALVYICLFVISVYYPRASLFSPLRPLVWSIIMYKVTFKNYSINK